MIYCWHSIKTWKVGPCFSSFNLCPSLPSVSTDDRKLFQCINILLNNKTGPLFWKFNWCKESFSFLIRLTVERGPWIYHVSTTVFHGWTVFQPWSTMLWRWSNHGLTMVNHERYMKNQKSMKNFPLFLSTWKNKQCISLCFPHNSFSYTRQLKLVTQSQRIYHLLQIKQGTPQCQLFANSVGAVSDQGDGPQGPAPPLIFRPNWGRKYGSASVE